MKAAKALPSLKSQETEPPPKTSPGYLTVKGAATYLGLAQKTIYNLFSLRRIPYFKLGCKPLFKPADLDQWMEAVRVIGPDEAIQQLRGLTAEERTLERMGETVKPPRSAQRAKGLGP